MLSCLVNARCLTIYQEVFKCIMSECSDCGEWHAVWDLAKRNPEIKPGWRVAWKHKGIDYVWEELTFGRKQDAERAVEAMYSLSDWNCGDTIECRRLALTIPVSRLRRTMIEALAW